MLIHRRVRCFQFPWSFGWTHVILDLKLFCESLESILKGISSTRFANDGTYKLNSNVQPLKIHLLGVGDQNNTLETHTFSNFFKRARILSLVRSLTPTTSSHWKTTMSLIQPDKQFGQGDLMSDTQILRFRWIFPNKMVGTCLQVFAYLVWSILCDFRQLFNISEFELWLWGELPRVCCSKLK